MEHPEFDRDADILPNEILDKHFGGGPDTAVIDGPEDPEPTEISPDDLPEDTSDEDPEDESEDTDFDEDGDEDPDEELDDDDLDDEEDDDLDDDEEDEEDEDDEEDLFAGKVTKEDHERIKNDPSLSKVHKEMQRAFTKKNQELATKRERQDRLDEALSTPQGMADYLSSMISQRPDVVGAAFEAVATGEGGYDFLVEVGVHDMETFERAYDRVHELQMDEGERGRHERDRDLRAKERDVSAREQKQRVAAFEESMNTIQDQVDAEAERFGIDADDMDEVKSRLKSKIRERVQADGSVDLSKSEVRAVAKEAKAHLDDVYKRTRAKLKRVEARKSQENAKRKAQSAKGRKRLPPRSRGTKPGKSGAFKPPPGRDPLDAFIDHRVEEL